MGFRKKVGRVTTRLAVIDVSDDGGTWARLAAEDLPNAVLQVVCDPDVNRAWQVADDTGAADACHAPIDTIKRNDVDAILLTNASGRFESLAIEAVRLGKPIFCDPVTLGLHTHCALVEAELTAKRILVQQSFPHRFDRLYAQLRSVISGHPDREKMQIAVRIPPRQVRQRHAGIEDHIYGLQEQLDALRYLAGVSVEAVSMRKEQFGLVASLECGAGARCEITCPTASTSPNRTEITASFGDDQVELKHEYGSVTSNGKLKTSHLPIALSDAFRRQVMRFTDFVFTGELDLTAGNAWDGLNASAMASALTQSWKASTTMAVEPPRRPDLYSRATQ